MEKKKPVRRNQSREELAEYFSDWQFDPERQCINRILRDHPEVTDAFVIESAAAEMLDAACSGVLLSAEDALRLVEYMEPVPLDALVKKLAESGVTDDNILDVIAKARMREEEPPVCTHSRHALHTANLLQRYADLLTVNRDILLLRLPEYDRHLDRAYMMLAFLGEALSPIEQRLLERMKDVADSVSMKKEHEVTRICFYIENIWEIA